MTRVLYLIPTMGGGGAERQLAYIALGRITRGWDVHVALYSGGANLERLRQSGAAIHEMNVRGNYDIASLATVIALIRHTRPDIVHTHLLQMDVVGGLAATVTRTPWVLAERASATAYANGFKNRLRVAVARTASAIEANSAAGIEYWSAKCPHVRKRVINCGLPFREIEDAPVADLDAYRGEQQRPIILFAGRFDEQKNVLTMLDALSRLFRECDAVAVLCGRGPLENSMRHRIDELGIADRVVLAGYVPDIWSWMKSADVFVSISHCEGRPNTVLEAAACRTPLVVSDIPEHREFLRDGESARFVDRHDPLSVSAALRQTLEARGAARRQAAAAFDAVSHFTIDAMAADLDALYNEILQQPASPKYGGAAEKVP